VVIDVVLKRFESPDEVRVFEKGRLEVVRIGAMTIGRVIELTEGSLFHVPAVPHDSWVVGDRPYVSLHFMGADQYAKR